MVLKYVFVELQFHGYLSKSFNLSSTEAENFACSKTAKEVMVTCNIINGIREEENYHYLYQSKGCLKVFSNADCFYVF
jgi:hypothetical protein